MVVGVPLAKVVVMVIVLVAVVVMPMVMLMATIMFMVSAIAILQSWPYHGHDHAMLDWQSYMFTAMVCDVIGLGRGQRNLTPPCL